MLDSKVGCGLARGWREQSSGTPQTLHPPALSASFKWRSNRVLGQLRGLLPIPLHICTQCHNSTQKARSSLGTRIFSSLFISGPETSKLCKEAAVLQKRMCKGPKHRMYKDHTDEGVVRHEHRWNPKGPTSRHAKRWVQTRVLSGLG